jgi:NADH-quinone oxidoreductase subunit K
MLFGIEFIFNAANINLVTFDSINGNNSGQIFTLFIILIAACETVIALAIILQLYKQYKHIDPSRTDSIKG